MARPFVHLLVALHLLATPAAIGQIRDTGFRSTALKRTLHFAIYLPPRYDGGNRRYPVVYFLHGLPASPTDYRQMGFVATVLEKLRREAIIVAPQAAVREDSDPEYLDDGPGRNWDTAIAAELPRYVDARYRTIADRRARSLVGLSAGGYGATLLALHHLDTFSVVESWSGYFRPTDPSGTHVLPHSPSQSAHSLVSLLAKDVRRRPTYFAFYVGKGDSRFRAENEQLNDELTAAHVPHVFRLYPGAHEQTLWQQHARDWLGLALDHMSAPR